MSHRTIGSVLIGLLCCGVPVLAQTPQALPSPGAAMPGPAAPRQPMPPRDGNAPLPTGTGRIRGRVVAAETGTPLRRAQVRIAGSQPGLQSTTNTDPDGRYEFGNLPASSYTINVSRPGYVPLQFGQQRPFEPGKPLTLADGQVADKIDFALPRGGVIAGKIVDEFGEPVAGLRLQAQRYQYQPGGTRRLIAVQLGSILVQPSTDDRGEFRVYGLTPGSYVLSAVPPTLGPSTTITAGGGGATSFANAGGSNANASDGFATTYFPGTANVADAQPVTVSAGQEVNASFPLASAKLSRISGVIRTSQGTAPSRITVALRTLSGNGSTSTNGTTQPDGTFVITNVLPGNHLIDVRPTPTFTGPIALSPGGPADGEFATVPVTVSGQDVTGLIITTALGATISGRLVFEGSPASRPGPQSFRVMATRPDPTEVGGYTSNGGIVDESGHFEIGGASGPLLFRTAAAAPEPLPPGWFLKSITLNGIDTTDIAYDAKPATTITGLEVTMTDRQTTLAGTVTNARGDAVKDYFVVIFPPNLREGILSNRFTRAVRPDQQGRYETKGLPPGDYVAVAVESLEQGGEWDPAFQQQMKPKGKSFSLTDGQSTALDLTLVQ